MHASALYKLNGAGTKKIALKVKGAKAVWPTKSEVTLDTCVVPSGQSVF